MSLLIKVNPLLSILEILCGNLPRISASTKFSNVDTLNGVDFPMSVKTYFMRFESL